MSHTHGKCSVTLVNPKTGDTKTLQIAPNEFILECGEVEGMELPYSCRAGACFDCLAKVARGKVEQTDKALSFLRPYEIEAGYVLLCAAYPTSDCTLTTHQAEEYLG